MNNRTLPFFINPKAGKGRLKGIRKIIDEACLANGFAPEYIQNGDEKSIRLILEEKEKIGVPFVFVAGGDGSVNSLARIMADYRMALGILPAGSGNGLANHLGIRSGVKGLSGLLADHRILEMDFGRINDIPFFTTAGAGFDAEVGYRFDKGVRRGFIGYFISFVKTIFRFKTFSVNVTVDGEELRYDAFVLTFANACQYGNSAIIAPGASVADRMLNLIVLKRFPVIAIPGLLIRLFSGTLNKSSYFISITCTRADVTLGSSGHFHYDGEMSSHHGVIHAELAKEKVRILVPVDFNDQV